MKQQLTLLLFLLLTVSAVNWQAADNITESNRTFIWGTIDNNIASYAPSNLPAFSTFISTALNQAWDPAWNVIVIRLIDPSIDAVLYGYAFRQHWLWFNGYTYGGNTFSFVIWKDYNCHTWNTVDNTGFQEYFADSSPHYQMVVPFVNALAKVNSGFRHEDPWSAIFTLIEKLQEQNPTKSYSAVMVSNGLTKNFYSVSNFTGTFCSLGGKETYIQTISSGIQVATGGFAGVFKLLVFQTH